VKRRNMMIEQPNWEMWGVTGEEVVVLKLSMPELNRERRRQTGKESSQGDYLFGRICMAFFS
jgi:hypothetical protein